MSRLNLTGTAPKSSMKIFADTSDIKEIAELNANPLIEGFTTNPTLMKKAGVKNYEAFCKKVLKIVSNKPISFEVFADDFDEMERQARKIASWGENVYVKIPITNTKGESSIPLIEELTKVMQLNITAITQKVQIASSLPKRISPHPKYFMMHIYEVPYLLSSLPMILSYFAGRVADTGTNPVLFINEIRSVARGMEILWASSREVLNIYQAKEAGADIITCTPDLIRKYEKFKGMDLEELSLLTVKQFYDDAKSCGFSL